MTAPPAFTTLPPNPSQIGTNAPGRTGTVSGSQTHSSTRHPTSSTGTSGGGDGSNGQGDTSRGKSNTTAIVVGTVVGMFGLTTGVAFTVWYFHRRHAQSGAAFSPLDDDDEEHPHSITAVPIVGSNEKGPRILALPLGLLSMVGLARQRDANRSRHDILADEDRSFDWEMLRHSGSARSGDVSARSSPHGWSNAVSTSLRNLTRSTGRGSHSRESTTASTIDREKRGADPFSPEVALMAEALERDELPEQAGPSRPYINPFADPNSSLEVLRDFLSGPEHEPQEDSQEERPTAHRTTVPTRVDFVPLSPLLEQASQNSLTHSLSSHNTSSEQPGGSSSTISGPPGSPRPSSILDLSPPPNEPIRRSNSWWSRFAKTPLLERKSSDASTRNPAGFIDFRDPNPPPRLLTIEESTHTHSPDVSESRRMGSVGISAAQAHMSRKHPSLYRETTHGRSASSLQTANTDTLERVGGTMDIVQRDGTLDSQSSALTNPFADDEFGVAGIGRSASASSSYVVSPLRALYVRGEPSHTSTPTESSCELPLPPPPPPPPAPATPEPPDVPSEESGEPPAFDSGIDVRPRVSAGGEPHSPGVSERVRAFERRMSRDIELPPPPTNTRRREERASPRPVVRYGLVPRPSLFVANPDGGPEREPRV
jgi:hypothetical protein